MPTELLAVSAAFTQLGASAVAFIWVRSRERVDLSPRSRVRRAWSQSTLVRTTAAGVVLGMACFFASVLGMAPIAAALVMVIAGFGALSTLGPKRAATAGAFGGSLAGIFESIFNAFTLVASHEGMAFGIVVGSVSGYFSGCAAERAPTQAIGSLAGAGTGVAVGALVTLGCYALVAILAPRAVEGAAIIEQGFEIVLVVWVILPMLNGVLDYISLGVSMRLGCLAMDHVHKAYVLILLYMLDLAVCVLLLSLTLELLALGLSGADRLLAPDLAPLEFLYQSLADPFGSGLWLTVMLLSTLVWTVLHFLLVAAPSLAARLAILLAHRRAEAQIAQASLEERLSFGTYLLSHSPGLAFMALYALICWAAVTLLAMLLSHMSSFLP